MRAKPHVTFYCFQDAEKIQHYLLLLPGYEGYEETPRLSSVVDRIRGKIRIIFCCYWDMVKTPDYFLLLPGCE
jgi:hypothetical protein